MQINLLLLLLLLTAARTAWSQEVAPASEERQAQAEPNASDVPATLETQQAQTGSSPSDTPATPEAQQTQTESPERGVAETSKPVTRLEEYTVTRRRPASSASLDTMRARDFELRPHTTTQQLLNNLPGLVVGQHQGGGKATQYFLRGFDADHGTDVAVFVDGVPVNFVSHAHGQGYADLNFLIPETVQRVELRKGPYFVEYGDLASAGSINIITKDDVAENSVQALGGRYNTMRYAAVASPRLGPVKTLLASEVYFNDGPFINPQNTAQYSLFSKLTWEPSPESKLSLWGSYYYSDWDASGQIPLREIHSGRLDRFGAVDPTEGGHSDRQNLNLIYTYTPAQEEQWFAQAYGTRYKLSLWSNFTFFLNNTVRGDGIEQNDQRYMYGGRLRYSRIWNLGSMTTQTTIGVETRNDEANVGLFNQQQRHRFETTTKVHVGEHSISGYLLQEFYLTEWARLQVGLRGDEFFFDVGNRLPPTATNATLIRGSTNDGLVNPKANLILSPFRNRDTLWRNTEFYFNFGMGYHSNDARDAVQAGTTPLSRSTGGEIGMRTNLWDRLDLAAALWIIDVNSEIVFVGDEGTTEG